jgi:hypothetical protein
MKKLLISAVLALMLVAVMAVPAMGAQDEESVGASVSVNEFVNITLSGSIDFGSLTPPQTEVGATGQSNGNPAITITVATETNVNVDISIKGAIATGTLALDNWKYSKAFDKVGIAGLTTSYVEVYDNVAKGSSNAFYHWITVPDGTASGTHTVTVSYKAVTHS